MRQFTVSCYRCIRPYEIAATSSRTFLKALRKLILDSQLRSSCLVVEIHSIGLYFLANEVQVATLLTLEKIARGIVSHYESQVCVFLPLPRGVRAIGRDTPTGTGVFWSQAFYQLKVIRARNFLIRKKIQQILMRTEGFQ